MKKLFGRDKPKTPKPPGAKDIASPGLPQENSHYFAHQQPPQDRNSIRLSSDDHWDIISSHDGNSPLLGHQSPRTVSPFQNPPALPPKVSSNGKGADRDPQLAKKKQGSAGSAPAAVSILKSLDPHPETPRLHVEHSDEYLADPAYREDKKERKGFWERASEKNKEKEREREKLKERERREEEGQAELTRMIGYLTATASEDWSLVLEVCERASMSEAHAKDAMKALKKEFKYAEAPAQLSAARLWAIMLRNCSGVFIQQCASRKFLDTLEDVLQASKTSPVVRERLLEVLAGAAYMSPSGGRHDKEGFRGLWRKVKAPEQPDEGIPFDTEDAMFNPPVPNFQEPPLTARPPDVPRRPSVKHKTSSRHRVIPPEEDMRRLFQECKVGSGNATLLSDALLFAKPEDLKNKDIIREFYARCRASQELIYGQIPWASAGAERSRLASGRGSPQAQKRTRSGGGEHPPSVKRSDSTEDRSEPTQEELLLAALLKANEELTDALRQYDDLERVGIERDTEERSKKETRIDRNHVYLDENGAATYLEPPHPHFGATSSHTPSPSSSPSPSPAPSVMVTSAHAHGHGPLPQPPPAPPAHAYPAHLSAPSLAPPPPAPHGPRRPSHANTARSRTPSPDRSSTTNSTQYYHDDVATAVSRLRVSDSESPESEEEYHEHHPLHRHHEHPHAQYQQQQQHPQEAQQPARPSAKALGKRRAAPVDDSDPPFDPDDLFYEHANDSRRSDDFADDDSDAASTKPPWHHPVHYVYDAAAERMQERLREGRLNATAPGLVH